MKKLFILAFIITFTLGLSSYVQATDIAAANKAADYLLTQRETSGSIGGVGFSAWALQALNATGRSSALTVNYLENNLGDIAAAPATDIERTVLAIISAGRDPRNFGGKDLITILRTKAQSDQIGLTGLLNDDIFGILALLAAGEEVTDPLVSGSISHLVSQQQANGSFSWSTSGVGDSNNTAVAIQALEFAKRQGWAGSYNRAAARAFLESVQKDSGGFAYQSNFDADGSSTAWVISAIRALGEDPDAWVKNGATPYQYLQSLQKENGGVSWGPDTAPDLFTTSFAAIAFAGKALPVAVITVEPSPSPSPSPTPSPSPSPSPSPTPSEEPSPSPSPSPSPEPTPSPSPSLSPSPTPSPSPTIVPTPSPSPSPSPSPTPSPSPSPTPEATPSPTPSPWPSPTPTPAAKSSSSPEPTPSPTPTVSPSPSVKGPTSTPHFLATVVRKAETVAHELLALDSDEEEPEVVFASLSPTPYMETPALPTSTQEVQGVLDEQPVLGRWITATIMIAVGVTLISWGIIHWLFTNKGRPKARF